MPKRVSGRLPALAPMLTALLAAAPAPPGTVQSYDGYKSWFVACDNTLACVAKGFTDTDQGTEIDVARQAGANGGIKVSIRGDKRFGLGDVRIDDGAAGLSTPGWRLTSADDETSATTTSLAAARALVAKLRDATKVSLGGDADVPLDGFAAAMLRLDERQGRIGGVTALFKPGAIAASRVPSAPPVPKIPNHPITATLAPGEAKRLIAAIRVSRAAVFQTEDCEANPAAMEPEAHALDGQRALVLIPCVMGAYQGSSLAFIASRSGGPARRLVAPMPYLGNDPDRSDADSFTESDFEPKTGTLSMSAKGRGLADCGMSASWIWNGTAFSLSAMTLQQACGGVEPGDWPTIFRSAQ